MKLTEQTFKAGTVYGTVYQLFQERRERLGQAIEADPENTSQLIQNYMGTLQNLVKHKNYCLEFACALIYARKDDLGVASFDETDPQQLVRLTALAYVAEEAGLGMNYDDNAAIERNFLSKIFYDKSGQMRPTKQLTRLMSEGFIGNVYTAHVQLEHQMALAEADFQDPGALDHYVGSIPDRAEVSGVCIEVVDKTPKQEPADPFIFNSPAQVARNDALEAKAIQGLGLFEFPAGFIVPLEEIIGESSEGELPVIQ